MRVMNRIDGMLEDFKEARVVYMTTFRDGKEESRQMTNFNEDPYKVMWFPTYRNTKKVDDIKRNPKTLITFPSSKVGVYYEIEGRAEFEDEATTARKWRWWYLYWKPDQRRRFWFPAGVSDPNRVIINVHPLSARTVKEG